MNSKIKYIAIAQIAIVVFILSYFSADAELSSFSKESLDSAAKKSFKIGFVKGDIEQGLSADMLSALRRFLLLEEKIKTNLKKEGYSDIALLPADGYRDLIRRMDHKEFELVFCPSVVYAEQEGDYQAVLQLRRERDIWDTRGGGKVLQKGVILVNNRSPLHNNKAVEASQIAEYLKQQRIAFVSSYSAPGYIYPMLKMYDDYGVTEPGGFLFCDSSEEVVKFVINGLVEVGTCESGTIEQVLGEIGLQVKPEKLVRIIFETPIIPTDPVVVREELFPPNSELGKSLKAGLKQFFNRPGSKTPRLENSQDSYYDDLRHEVKRFDLLKKE